MEFPRQLYEHLQCRGHRPQQIRLWNGRRQVSKNKLWVSKARSGPRKNKSITLVDGMHVMQLTHTSATQTPLRSQCTYVHTTHLPQFCPSSSFVQFAPHFQLCPIASPCAPQFQLCPVVPPVPIVSTCVPHFQLCPIVSTYVPLSKSHVPAHTDTRTHPPLPWQTPSFG